MRIKTRLLSIIKIINSAFCDQTEQFPVESPSPRSFLTKKCVVNTFNDREGRYRYILPGLGQFHYLGTRIGRVRTAKEETARFQRTQNLGGHHDVQFRMAGEDDLCDVFLFVLKP